MGRLIPPLIGSASSALTLRGRFDSFRRSPPPAHTYLLLLMSRKMSMSFFASCLSLVHTSPSQMETPAQQTAECQTMACSLSTSSTLPFAMRCSTLPLYAFHSRLARAGHVCLRRLGEELKTPTGRRWLAPTPTYSITQVTRTG